MPGKPKSKCLRKTAVFLWGEARRSSPTVPVLMLAKKTCPITEHKEGMTEHKTLNTGPDQ